MQQLHLVLNVPMQVFKTKIWPADTNVQCKSLNGHVSLNVNHGTVSSKSLWQIKLLFIAAENLRQSLEKARDSREKAARKVGANIRCNRILNTKWRGRYAIPMPCHSPDLLQQWPVSCKLLKRRGPCSGPVCNQILGPCMYMDMY